MAQNSLKAPCDQEHSKLGLMITFSPSKCHLRLALSLGSGILDNLRASRPFCTTPEGPGSGQQPQARGSAPSPFRLPISTTPHLQGDLQDTINE